MTIDARTAILTAVVAALVTLSLTLAILAFAGASWGTPLTEEQVQKIECYDLYAEVSETEEGSLEEEQAFDKVYERGCFP